MQNDMKDHGGENRRFLSSPAHNCTPTMPKMKKTKKHSASTLPSMGRVSRRRAYTAVLFASLLLRELLCAFDLLRCPEVIRILLCHPN
ncbi:hypothetical protein EYF80_029510 [Liparis tanakae]|uniref:Uncharacterized protein n=1 Tax=Liparis tanakae TaxID=230148 RepID=A0A4Z2H313_9TELE|nr:hypothetical protein EYF80_029510 [Liparis tanakae]